MKNKNLFPLILITFIIVCQPVPSVTPAVSQQTIAAISTNESQSNDEFLNRKNSFGDGYIAHVLIKDTLSATNEEIVNILVSQWLEHYKSNSEAEQAMINDYQVGEITLLERLPGEPVIVASVWFSIIPAHIPNDWASFPGDEITSDNPWWRLAAPFGIYKGNEYYSLGLLFGRGT